MAASLRSANAAAFLPSSERFAQATNMCSSARKLPWGRMAGFHPQQGAASVRSTLLKGCDSHRFLPLSGAVSVSPLKLCNPRSAVHAQGLTLCRAVSAAPGSPHCFQKQLQSERNQGKVKKSTRVDAGTVEAQSDNATTDSIPVLMLSEVAERLQSTTNAKSQAFRAMYSSVIEAITTDPAAMVIRLDDHMVHRGHGVFDTAIIFNGHLYELDMHLDRLLRSAAMAKITPPYDRATLRHILVQTVAASGCRGGSLRYWLSAGVGGFTLSSAECYKSTFYAVVYDYKYYGPEGVKVVTSTIPIKPPMFATVKSVNYLPNVLAQLEAEEQGAFTGIWLDQEGFIAEGPNMNVAFLTHNGVLLIPPFDNVLAGCTARRVLALADEKAIAGLAGVKFQRVTMHEAKAAAEMMLIGSSVLVKPVVEWDGQPVGDGLEGPVTLAIREALERDLENPEPGLLVAVPYKDGL